MARGGKREGAGRKPGQRVLDKIMAREELRRRVIEQLGPLVDAQMLRHGPLDEQIAPAIDRHCVGLVVEEERARRQAAKSEHPCVSSRRPGA